MPSSKPSRSSKSTLGSFNLPVPAASCNGSGMENASVLVDEALQALQPPKTLLLLLPRWRAGGALCTNTRGRKGPKILKSTTPFERRGRQCTSYHYYDNGASAPRRTEVGEDVVDLRRKSNGGSSCPRAPAWTRRGQSTAIRPLLA